jgi:hypothetical protein
VSRLVLDTNVVVSAFLTSRGNENKVLQLAFLFRSSAVHVAGDPGCAHPRQAKLRAETERLGAEDNVYYLLTPSPSVRL